MRRRMPRCELSISRLVARWRFSTRSRSCFAACKSSCRRPPKPTSCECEGLAGFSAGAPLSHRHAPAGDAGPPRHPPTHTALFTPGGGALRSRRADRRPRPARERRRTAAVADLPAALAALRTEPLRPARRRGRRAPAPRRHAPEPRRALLGAQLEAKRAARGRGGQQDHRQLRHRDLDAQRERPSRPDGRRQAARAALQPRGRARLPGTGRRHEAAARVRFDQTNPRLVSSALACSHRCCRRACAGRRRWSDAGE